jgi:hypothetical protein
MSNHDYQNLVASLKAEGADKKQVSIKVLYLIWLLFSLVFSAIIMTIIGIRSDYPSLFESKQFILETISLLWLYIITSGWAIKLSLPGREVSFHLWKSFTPFAIWSLLLAISYFYEYTTYSFIDDIRMTFGPVCFTSLFTIGLLSSFILFIMVKKNRPTLLKRSSLMIFFSGMSLAALLMQFHCSNNNPMHIITSHLLPVIIISVLGYIVGRKILRW